MNVLLEALERDVMLVIRFGHIVDGIARQTNRLANFGTERDRIVAHQIRTAGVGAFLAACEDRRLFECKLHEFQ